MPKPTHQDAEIVFSMLSHLRTEKFQEARGWLLRDYSATDYAEFKRKYPMGSEEYNRVTFVLGFFEVIATLITHGLFNEDLFFDIGFGFNTYWDKVKAVIPGWRKDTVPNLWENLEWLADRSDVWAKAVWKPGMKWKAATMPK
jgi:hypothetical protein